VSDQQPEVAGEGSGETLSAVLDKKDEVIPFELVETEKLENSQSRFTVKVPADEFSKRADEVLKDYRKQASIPGFRKGKAPIALIKNRFAKHAREEAVRKMGAKLADQVIEQEKLDTIGQAIYDGWELDDDKNAVVKIIIELKPEINITEDTFKDITIEVVDQNVTKEDIEKELERIRENSATFDPVEGDATYEDKDGATISIKATNPQGVELPQLTVNSEYSENLQNELPKVAYDALVGKKKGETFTVENVELGQEPNKSYAHLEVTIEDIKKRVLPVLDDEFAKDVSSEYEKLEDLKASVKKDLEANAENKEKNDILNGVYEQLRSRLEFEIPPSLLNQATQRGLARAEQSLSQYGMSLRKMGHDFVNNFVERSQAEGRVEVQNSLIANALTSYLDTEVTDEAFDEEIAKLAEAQGRKPLAIRAQLEAQKKLDQFRDELKIRLTNDKLISMVEVKKVDKPAEPAKAESESSEDSESEKSEE